MKYVIRSEGRDHVVEIDSFELAGGGVNVIARVDGRPYGLRLHSVESGVWWFLEGTRSREAFVSSTPNGLIAVELGRPRCEFLVLDRRGRLAEARRKTRGVDTRTEIRAPMPGRVVQVLVSDGETVDEGQAVAVIEAMKMQNEVRAPRGGIVRVGIGAGQAVNAGDIVFAIE